MIKRGNTHVQTHLCRILSYVGRGDGILVAWMRAARGGQRHQPGAQRADQLFAMHDKTSFLGRGRKAARVKQIYKLSSFPLRRRMQSSPFAACRGVFARRLKNCMNV